VTEPETDLLPQPMSAYAVLVARFLGFDEDKAPLIDLGQGPQAAHSIAPLLPTDVGATLALARIEDGALLILGLLGPPDRLCIEADDRLALRCGAAAVLFKEDGRVNLRGRRLALRAVGAARLEGASVRVN
jgi:hypothetical protein